MKIIYSLIMYVLGSSYLILRFLRSSDYRTRFYERFGFNNLKSSDILIHAASMGETKVITPIIKKILEQYPDVKITVTSTSPTGSKLISNLFGTSVQHCYLPIDTNLIMKCFVAKLRPKLCLLVERELWPNLCRYLKHTNTSIVLVNARLSAKSAKIYQRFNFFFKPTLDTLDKICAQSKEEAERFINLGISEEKITVCNSIKFDLDIDSIELDKAAVFRKSVTHSPIWVAGSVHPSEVDVLLDTHKKLLNIYPNALLILVPRHPEEFEYFYKESKKYFITSRYSTMNNINDAQVLLGDAMGVLQMLYACGTVAFVGGSLSKTGGQNPLEPIMLGIPVMMGPSYYNFSDIVTRLIDNKILIEIKSSEDLFFNIKELLEDPQKYIEIKENAKIFISKNMGSTKKHFAIIKDILDRKRQ